MSETDKITMFLEGLRSATQSELNYNLPNKLEDAMKMVINYDDAHFQKVTTTPKNVARPQPRKERIVYVPKLETSSSDTTEPMDLDAINRTRERFHKTSDKTTLSGSGCFKCGKMGHITRNCKGKAKDKSVVVSSVEKGNEKPRENAECHTMAKCSKESERLESEYEKLIRFNGSINKKKAWLLLDSGSARNFIDKTFVKQQNLKCQNIELFTIELADGTNKEIIQTIFIWELKIGTYKANGIKAYVIDL